MVQRYREGPFKNIVGGRQGLVTHTRSQEEERLDCVAVAGVGDWNREIANAGGDLWGVLLLQ